MEFRETLATESSVEEGERVWEVLATNQCNSNRLWYMLMSCHAIESNWCEHTTEMSLNLQSRVTSHKQHNARPHTLHKCDQHMCLSQSPYFFETSEVKLLKTQTQIQNTEHTISNRYSIMNHESGSFVWCMINYCYCCLICFSCFWTPYQDTQQASWRKQWRSSVNTFVASLNRQHSWSDTKSNRCRCLNPIHSHRNSCFTCAGKSSWFDMFAFFSKKIAPTTKQCKLYQMNYIHQVVKL